MSRRPKRASERPEPQSPAAAPVATGSWTPRFIRNVLLWLLPVWALWALVTPAYNRFLLSAGSSLLHLSERPAVTVFHFNDAHDATVERRDFPPGRALAGPGFRVTDLHFHLVLLGALFLAVPGVPWRRRLENLGWAVLATVFFDILLVFLYVKFLYATQLGSWSLAHYGPLARNVYGLGKHLLDLPGKLALPLVLWAAFYLRLLDADRR